MLGLNPSHPKFSMADEVLARVPCRPGYAVVKDIVGDLGLSNQHEVTGIIKELATEGVAIHSFNSPAGRALWIEPSGWLAVQERAKAYLKSITKRKAK